ncbi:MAG: hypothetical protein RLZZ595_69 [Bacteroidota bacterium]
MKRFVGVFALLLFSCILLNCKPSEKRVDTQQLAHQLVKKLTDVMIVDIFTPPVASRIYANCIIAMYEAGRLSEEGYPSIAQHLRGFDSFPVPDQNKKYDYAVASIQAFCETAKKVTFSAPEFGNYRDSMIAVYGAGLSKDVLENSIAFGQSVADVVGKRLSTDQYKETRGMDRFAVVTSIQNLWVPTSPDYADALEPNWMKMLPMTLKTADEVKALPYPEYNENKNSAYYKELLEVYTLSKGLTEEQIDIAIFWDDNPFVSQHKGHVMFQDKKMTPPGHWLAIAKKACKDKGLGFAASAKAYAYTSIALYDGFIACWNEKYRTVRIRPQTAIQRLLEEQWISYIQTPPFPEYTSGHSTVSSAAAEMLTHLLGDNHAFIDSSELEYNLPVRSFKSFRDAALEASISRVYGGIHYRSGCENGNLMGKEIGRLVIERIEKSAQ